MVVLLLVLDDDDDDEEEDEGAEGEEGAAVADAKNVLANAALHSRCTYKHKKSTSKIRCDNMSSPSILLLYVAVDVAVVVDDEVVDVVAVDVDDDGMVAMVILGAHALQQHKTQVRNR